MENKFIIDIYFRLHHLMCLAGEMSQCKANPDWIEAIYHAASDYARELLEFPEDEIKEATKHCMKQDGSFEYMIKTCKELVEQHTHED